MPRTKGDEIELGMEQVEAALRERRWFAAESLAAEAVRKARAAGRFGEIARILLPLQEARRQRAAEASEKGKVRILDEHPPEGSPIDSGLLLVQPPLVGADARRLRLAALEQEVPLLVACREPLTRANTCPIVAIGETTLRVRIEPPRRPEAPTKAWFLAALEQLGDAAIAAIDPGQDLVRRIDHLIACLETHPDHEKLHQVLAELCREADRRGVVAAPRAADAVDAASDDPDPDADEA
jgi:hypothetical protein